jgi:uncharacterized protein YjdB
MAAKRLALAVLVLAGCGTKVADVSRLDVTVNFDETTVMVDQLRFEVSQNKQLLFPAAIKPDTANGLLTSGATVSILLPDRALGQTLSLRVVGMLGGLDVTSGQVDNLAPLPDRGISVTVQLGHILQTLEPTPTSLSVPVGLVQQITVRGTFSDGVDGDVTDQADWSSADPTIATVDNTPGTRGLVTAVAEGATTITATLQGQSVQIPVTVTPKRLVSLSIAPNPLTLPLGTSRLLRATATYSDNSHPMVTVNWSSTDPTIAPVDGTGMLTTLQTGSVTITASLNGVSTTALVIVVVPALSAIVVEPSNAQIAAGYTQRFVAYGLYTDGSNLNLSSSVAWSTSDPTIATVSTAIGQEGVVTGVQAGMFDVRAQSGTIMGSMPANITNAVLTQIDLTPTTPSIAKGTSQRFIATGHYSDGTTGDVSNQVAWTSGTTATATVDTTGLAAGSNAGSSIITATLSSVAAHTTLTVTAATLTSIEVTPTAPSIAKGTKVTLTATGRYSDGSTQDLSSTALWSSTAGTIASVSGGLTTGVAKGMASIVATFAGKSGSTLVTVTDATLDSIQVTPLSPSIAAGTKQQFAASGTYSDGSSQDLTGTVTWTSSDNTVAVISNSGATKGVASGLKTGGVTITASFGGTSGTAGLSITAAVLNSIAVSPTNPAVPAGMTQNLTAIGTYSDNSTQDVTALAQWQSSAVNTATVSNAPGSQGLVTGVASGPATVTAQIGSGAGMVMGGTTVNVTNAVLQSLTIAPASSSLAKGLTEQLTVSGAYSDGTHKDLTGAVTWNTSAPLVATVSNGASPGTVTAVGSGPVTITAQLGAVSTTASVQVTSAILQSITIMPASVSLIEGTTAQLAAQGNYSDTSTLDLTASVTWSTGDVTIAVVSNATGTQGQVYGVAASTTAVMAQLGPISGSGLITVRAATLTSIAVSTSTPATPAGLTAQFSALGTYSNSTSQDLTTAVTWSVDDTGTATVSNASGTQGLATGVAMGTTTVRATLSGISGSASLEVDAPIFQSVSVEPQAPVMNAADTLQLAATAHYSDLSKTDVTAMASWSGDNDAAATVDSGGLCTAVATGTANISATYMGQTGATTVTVN